MDADALLLAAAVRRGLVRPEVATILQTEKARTRTSFEALLARGLAPEVLESLRNDVRKAISRTQQALVSSLEASHPDAQTVLLGPPATAATVVSARPSEAQKPPEVPRIAPGTRFGRYVLLEELGRGGMGVVFKARQTDLERVVALKMMTLVGGPGMAEKLRRRFQTEAKAAAKLQHPGIVSIHDVGEEGGIPYFTMDFVPGRTLSERIRQGLDREAAVGIAVALADAVGYAHEQGVVHRDLKPANVLLDDRLRPHILDFGVAKDLTRADGATLDGEVLGTPNYMPPEQAEGRVREVGPRSDVYSLGAILYDMLTGRPPFTGATQFSIVKEVLTRPPDPPRKLDPTISPELEEIVLRCLEKDPAGRFQTAGELVDALERVVSGPNEKGPPPAPRSPVGVAAVIGAVLLVLASGGLVVNALVARARDEAAQTAEKEKAEKEAREKAEEARRHPAAALLAAVREKAALGAPPAEIEAGFHRALEAEPGSAEAAAELGTFVLRLGDVAEAKKRLQAAPRAADPRVAALVDALRAAVAKEDAAQERLALEISMASKELRSQEALASAQAAVKERPRAASLQQALARILAVHGRGREALAAADEAVRLDKAISGTLEPRVEEAIRSDADVALPAGFGPLSRSWEPILGGVWGEQGGVLQGLGHGHGDYNLAVLLRSEAGPTEGYSASVEVFLESGDPGAFAGLVFGARSAEDFYLAYLWDQPALIPERFKREDLEALAKKTSDPPKGLRLARVVKGKWSYRGELLVAFPDKAWVRLGVSAPGGNKVTISVAGRTVSLALDRDAAGRAGVLKFYDTKVRFRDFEWRTLR